LHLSVGMLWATMETPRPRPLGARRAVLAWVPVVAWAALIFLASAQPNLRFVPDDSLDFVVRKLGHMGVFGILALLLWRALATTTGLRRPWVWALALAILYAITDELHQGGTMGRHASPVDVAIDATGTLIAVGLIAGVVHIRRRARRM
jgi:VanZ family protein